MKRQHLVAGSLAGAASLAAGHAAYAETVISPVGNLSLNLAGGSKFVDINGDGLLDFRFQAFYGDLDNGGIFPLGYGRFTASSYGTLPYYYQVTPAIEGATVGYDTLNEPNAVLLSYAGSLLVAGPTVFVVSSFTDAMDEQHLCWLEMTLTSGRFNTGANRLVSAGYNTVSVPDGADSITVPEPGSAEALALGAVGVLALRRKRSAA
jgi:hypothetical protein